MDTDERLVHLWDFPHIIKNVRNNMLTSNLELGEDKKIAKWRDLIEFYKTEELWGCKVSKLTLKHLNPVARDKMRVLYAAQVFSKSTANCMKIVLRASGYSLLSGCESFVELCEDVDLFFDLCNGPRGSRSEEGKPMRLNVSEGSVHHTEWNKIVTKLKTWTFIRKKDGSRHIPVCVKGWIENISTLKHLVVQSESLKIKCVEVASPQSRCY